jgi:hypothetical protein
MDFNCGKLVILQGRAYVVLATVATDPPETLVVDVRSGHPVLSPRGGGIGLPSVDGVALLSGAASDEAAADIDFATERMRIELDLLDRAGVRNGTKAIWLWLAANWSEDLRRRFGDFDDPATIKRWRTELRRLHGAKTS